MRVLIVGASGFIGRYLVRRLSETPGLEAIGTFLSHPPAPDGNAWHRVDLTDAAGLERIFRSARPGVVVQLAAVADVGTAEREQARATAVNVTATSTIARLCDWHGAKLVYVSTEYVFDGEHGFYREDDTPGPTTHYGQTKWQAEQEVEKLASLWSILRTSIVYGWRAEARRNFVPWLLERLRSGQPYHGPTAVYRTPVYVEHLVDGIARLVEEDYPGIHHVAGIDWVSMYDFAVAVAEGFGLDRGLVIPAEESRSGEILGLDCARTMRLLGLAHPGLADGIEAMRARAPQPLTTYSNGTVTIWLRPHSRIDADVGGNMPIEQVSPELERIVSLDQNIEVLGTGYVGGEGPLWWKEDQCLLFSEVRGNRRRRWSAGEGVTLVQEPTNNANGLTRDPQGRLVMCEGGARRVSRVEHDGSITVIASNYHGRRLNRPNDVVVKSDGSIYFTDPGGPSADTDLDFAGVYRVSADLSSINLLVRDYVLPNGLTFSVDESILYINDSQGLVVRDDIFRSIGHIDAFDVRANGMLANRRVFCELRGEGTGIPDGMKVDVEGNVYCTGPGGVWVMDATGKHLGTILTEVEHTTNIAWGGDDWRTLFITTPEILARIQLKIAGMPVPA